MLIVINDEERKGGKAEKKPQLRSFTSDDLKTRLHWLAAWIVEWCNSCNIKAWNHEFVRSFTGIARVEEGCGMRFAYINVYGMLE